MGASLSWLAVRGKSRQTVCAELGLRGSTRREVYPHSPVTGAVLPDGWYLVVENHRLRNQFVRDSVLARLSAGCEIITCSVEEHVMCSEAAGWMNGVKTWSVIHNAEVGHDDLRTHGNVPPNFNSIRDRLTANQDEEVDFCFDVPVELAESFTGFRHDASVAGLEGTPFEVFVARSYSRTIFRILVGLMVLVFGPIGYLRTLATVRETSVEADKKTKPRLGEGLGTLALVVTSLGAWIGVSFGLFRLVWLFHVWLYPGHQLHDFWGTGISFRSFVPSFLMVFAPVPGAMAFGFLAGVLLAWSVTPRSAGKDFRSAALGLLKFGIGATIGGLAVALIAASLLKSLR